MAIYRGPGGAGDATNDASSQAIIATQAAQEAEAAKLEAQAYAEQVKGVVEIKSNQFTGDGSTTSFVLSAAPANKTNVIVEVDGVVQQTSSYSVSGSTLTFTEAPYNGAAIETRIISNTGTLNSAQAENVSFYQAGSGAVTRDVQSKIRETISVKDFGAVGDGVTDDTAAIQNAFNAAVDKVVLLGPNETYAITAITIPARVTLIANNSVFRKLAASSTAAITVNDNFNADLLSVSSPGSSVDNGVRIKGSYVYVDFLKVTSDSVDSNYGLQIQSSNGTQLEKIIVNNVTISNYKSGILHYYIKDSNINNIRITSYVTGVYLRDSSNCNFRGALLTTTSPSSTGGPGQNGLLVESTLSSGSSNNLRFYDWSVANAGEHSYRFGGQYTISDVWLTNCRSNLSGNAGASATGGCGFKVLGATSVANQKHKNFFFSNCKVTDVSTTGDGIGNFCGFLIAVAENVHISNCSVSQGSNTYSSWHGMSFESVKGIFLTNNYVKDCKQHALRFVSAIYTALPGFTGIVDTVNISGGFYEVTTGTGSLVMYLDCTNGDTVGTFSNIKTSGIVISNGIGAIRCQGTTTWTNCYADVTYINPGDITGAPPYQGTDDWMLTAKGLYYGSYGVGCLNGSSFQDTAGNFKVKKSGVWVNI